MANDGCEEFAPAQVKISAAAPPPSSHAGEHNGGAKVPDRRGARIPFFGAELIDLDHGCVTVGPISEFVFVISDAARRFVGPNRTTVQQRYASNRAYGSAQLEAP